MTDDQKREKGETDEERNIKLDRMLCSSDTGSIVYCHICRTESTGRWTFDGGHTSGRDNLICDKLSYRFTDPERFDIVVIYPDDQKDKRWIKRIIGLPGETVRIDEEGNIYINGEILDEDYGREVIQDPGLAAQEITLGEDEYWCMGDNRNHSSDSRVIGPVPRSHILGKAFVRIYPFSKFGLIH